MPPMMETAGTNQPRKEAAAAGGAPTEAHDGAVDDGAHGWQAAALVEGSVP